MAKVTKVNYTDAQIATMTASYKGVDNKKEVAMIAADLGKTAASVRAKLSNLGVYKTATPAKGEGKGNTKADIVGAIAVAGGFTLSEAEQEGLAKATAGPLAKILASLTNREESESESDSE